MHSIAPSYSGCPWKMEKMSAVRSADVRRSMSRYTYYGYTVAMLTGLQRPTQRQEVAEEPQRPDDIIGVDEHTAEEEGSKPEVQVVEEAEEHAWRDGEHLCHALEGPAGGDPDEHGLVRVRIRVRVNVRVRVRVRVRVMARHREVGPVPVAYDEGRHH